MINLDKLQLQFLVFQFQCLGWGLIYQSFLSVCFNLNIKASLHN